MPYIERRFADIWNAPNFENRRDECRIRIRGHEAVILEGRQTHLPLVGRRLGILFEIRSLVPLPQALLRRLAGDENPCGEQPQ